MDNAELLKNLQETLQDMDGQISHLRKKVFFQDACFQTLRKYAVTRIAEIANINSGAEFDQISKLLRKTYDEYISKLEEVDPAFAAAIDMRSEMSEADQDLWYRLSEHLPKKDDPPDAGSKDRK